MITPPLLKTGDSIGIVAPSRMITSDQVDVAFDVFRQWGLTVKKGPSLFNSYGYFAGTDKERLNDLQNFINDDSIKAIFCARGGYGMTRIVDQLDLSKLKDTPKWIIGFSDITALHLALQQINVESIHGLMPVQYGHEGVEGSLKSLRQLLFEGSGEILAEGNNHNKAGKATGTLVGGNLSLVVESLGTNTEIQTEGSILFLEEIDEYLYKIDRMLMQLRRAGKLEHLAGLVVGDFSDANDTSIKFGKNVEQLIAAHFEGYKYPVAFGFPIGHEAVNMAVPVSRKVELLVEKNKSVLSF